MTNIQVLYTDNSLYDISNVLDKNWDRIYNGQLMSNIYKVTELWWNEVHDFGGNKYIIANLKNVIAPFDAITFNI